MEVYLGIDVSKGYSDFVLLNKEHKILEPPLQLDDTQQGHNRLRQWLHDIVEKHGVSSIKAAVESTGGFEDNWFSLLFALSSELPVRVARLNPVVVKNAAKAGLDTQVTDSLSARNIAAYLVRYGEQVDYRQPDIKYRSYRSLQNHINVLTRQKIRMTNELKQLIYSCFPELQRYCRKAVPTWVLELLVPYPVKEKLSRAKPQTVAKIKSVTREKAERLVTIAKNSVGARNGQTYAFLIKLMASDILSMQKRLAQLKVHLQESCKGPEVELVQSVRGIGAYSAASVMIQIEDINRFASPGQLVGYLGFYPTLKESGDKKHVSRMSKKGHSAIRATLFMCANTAVIHDPHF